MHEGAWRFLAATIISFGLEDARVVDFGGRDINGNVHECFEHKPWVIDVEPGRGVDEIADAAEWRTDEPYEVVLCSETLEHTPRWPDIIGSAYEALEPGGMLLVTCATADRPPHGAATDDVQPGEYYANVDDAALVEMLKAAGFDTLFARVADGVFGNDDLYAWAIR